MSVHHLRGDCFGRTITAFATTYKKKEPALLMAAQVLHKRCPLVSPEVPLFQFEEGGQGGTVLCSHHNFVAGTRLSRCLPVEDELTRGGIIAQACSAGSNRLDRVFATARCAGNSIGLN